MPLVHNVSINEPSWPDEVAAQAHCDCGWNGPRRSRANAILLAQEDAWDHIESTQRAANAERAVLVA